MFLNDIEQNLQCLVKPSCVKLLADPVNTCGDLRSIVLYGNEQIFLKVIAYKIIKAFFGASNIQKRSSVFSYVGANSTQHDIEYMHSDYHFEFDYSEKHVKLMKSILTNRPFGNRKFVFLITGIVGNVEASQLPLKQMIDIENNSIFIFITRSIGRLHESIRSRSVEFNASFPLAKLHKYLLEKVPDADLDLKTFTSLYHESNRSMMAVLIKLEHQENSIRLFDYLDKLLTSLKKDKNQLQVINNIREFVYKVYHLAIPFKIIAEYVVQKCAKSTKATDIYDVVQIAANCEREAAISNKDILLYEKFFVNLRQLWYKSKA